MAQVQRVDGISLGAEGLLPKITQEKESYVLTAKELSIVWGSDDRYWKWDSIPDPNRLRFGELLTVAELTEVCFLQIDGKYPSKNLVKGRKYEVHFVVKLKNDIVMNGPVFLKLTCPDGSTKERQEDLMNKPKNECIYLKVGEFDMTCTCDKNVEFSLNGCDGTTWKKGLIVIGAVISAEPYVLTAKELSIVWGSDDRYWKWDSIPDPNRLRFGELLPVAELIEVCLLQIDGKYPAKNLVKGIKYEVRFVVKLKNDIFMKGPVTLKLTCPDGSIVEHQEDLMKKPQNEWIDLKVGEFDMTSTCDKNVEFSLNGCDGTTWKRGLIVIGAVILAV